MSQRGLSRKSASAGRRRISEQGSAVITVLILAAVTAVIASGFLFRSVQEAKLATRGHFQIVALNLAEAGIEEGLHAANSAAINSANGWSLASGSTTDYVKTITTGFNFDQATGAIYVRVDNAASSTPTVIAACSVTIPNQPKIVKQIRVGSTAPVRLFANGIVAKGNVTFSGSADIDSYDSSVGAYNAATNRSDRATVASLVTVQVTGSATIYGYVATAGTTPSVGGSGRIYGATSPSSPRVDPNRVRTDFSTNLLDATAPTTSAYSLGAYSVAGSSTASLPRGGDVAGANGRYLYTCSSLSVGGSGILNILGPVDVIVTGNTSIGGSGYIAVGGTGAVSPSLNIYCPGTLDLSGSGMVNNTSLPINATIWGTKPTGSTQTVTVGGSAAFRGTIYAPNGNVSVTGSGGVYGAIIGNTVTLSGSGDVHYDVQLATAAVPGGPSPGTGSGSGYLRIGSWSELKEAPGSGHAFARDNRAPFTTLF